MLQKPVDLVFAFFIAQGNSPAQFHYHMPPRSIADLADAPLTPGVSVGPNQEWMLIFEHSALPPISELAQPELKLAGMRINPRTSLSGRPQFSVEKA